MVARAAVVRVGVAREAARVVARVAAKVVGLVESGRLRLLHVGALPIQKRWVSSHKGSTRPA